MLLLSRDFGVTWDEKIQQLYGERVWRFLAEGLDDDWFRPGGLRMYLYGGLFDTACVAVQRVLSGDIWMTRHYVNAAFGWLGIVYVGRLGRLLYGPGTGLLAMVLLTLSPRYFGDAMNNPKDLPLAALMAAALYYLMRLEPQYPYLGWRLAIPLTLAIGLAVNVRSGALILLAYLAIALLGLVIGTRPLSFARVVATFARWAALALAVLLLGTVFWPWARIRPFTRPLQGMITISRLPWNFPVLFDGAEVPATALPWTYVPQWVLITTPPVVLVGSVLSLLLLARRGTAGPLAWRVRALWGVALLPVTHVVLSGATLYDGVRHLLFTYPPLVVLAAAGWRGSLDNSSRKLKAVAALALGLGVLEPALFQWRNHPNQAVYFNALAGGPRGAFGRYELDYWGNSVLQAARWADRAAKVSGIRLVVSGAPHHVVRDDVRRFGSLDYAREELGAHHLTVVVLRGPRQDVLDMASRADVVHAVTTADGAPLTVVIPGPRYAEVEGALQKASPLPARPEIP
jgi:4-amino-4-deoxy-L-arabinose transferase-like glycosyltransferase